LKGCTFSILGRDANEVQFVSIVVTQGRGRIQGLNSLGPFRQVQFLSRIGNRVYRYIITGKEFTDVVEPLLSGIVLGLIPITLAGLFVAAYLQYKRGDEFEEES
jgi:cytochrome b6-f complex subunit 5